MGLQRTYFGQVADSQYLTGRSNWSAYFGALGLAYGGRGGIGIRFDSCMWLNFFTFEFWVVVGKNGWGEVPYAVGKVSHYYLV